MKTFPHESALKYLNVFIIHYCRMLASRFIAREILWDVESKGLRICIDFILDLFESFWFSDVIFAINSVSTKWIFCRCEATSQWRFYWNNFMLHFNIDWFFMAKRKRIKITDCMQFISGADVCFKVEGIGENFKREKP